MELAKPLSANGEAPTVGADGQPPVLLSVVRSGTRFAAPRSSLLRFSRVAASILDGAADDEELPLDNPHCTDDSLAHYVTWLTVHVTCDEVTRVPVPLPDASKASIFGAADLAFIETYLVPSGDMKRASALFNFMGLSVFLGSQISLELATGYLAFKVREASETLGAGVTPTAAVRQWFGLDGDFSATEMKTLADKYRWCKNIDHTQLERDSQEAHDTAAAALRRRHAAERTE
jgi:hypothetical protein